MAFVTSSTPGSDLTLSVDPVVLVEAVPVAAPPCNPKEADRDDDPPKGFWKS